MAYWTVSGNACNDAAKARETRKALSATNWGAEMKRLEKEAEKVRDVEIGRRAEREINNLRQEWKAAYRNKYFVENGRQLPDGHHMW